MYSIYVNRSISQTIDTERESSIDICLFVGTYFFNIVIENSLTYNFFFHWRILFSVLILEWFPIECDTMSDNNQRNKNIE
jgi:hypothetical protein